MTDSLAMSIELSFKALLMVLHLGQQEHNHVQPNRPNIVVDLHALKASVFNAHFSSKRNNNLSTSLTNPRQSYSFGTVEGPEICETA